MITGRATLVVGLALGAVFFACSSDDVASQEPDAGPNLPLDGGEAGAQIDASDARACDDCAFFPSDCGPDRFCPVEVVIEATHRLRALAGTSPADIWAVGTRGTVAHFDGAKWQLSTIADSEALSSVIAFSRDEVWSSGMLTTIYVRSSAPQEDAGTDGWTRNETIEAPDTQSYGYGAIRGASRIGPTTWFVTEANSGQSSALARVRRTPDGIETATVTVADESRFMAVHALSENEVWAVGAVGNAQRVTDATAATPTIKVFNTRTFASLRGVWGATPSDVWAVGGEGTVRHYSGEGYVWDVVADVPTQTTLRAITGTSASDIWAVGDDATVIHYDGTRWSRVAIGKMGARRPALHAIWAPSPGRVWIAGDGVLLSLGEKGGAP